MKYPTEVKLKLNLLCEILINRICYYVTVIKTSKVDPFTIYKSRTTIIFGIFG